MFHIKSLFVVAVEYLGTICMSLTLGWSLDDSVLGVKMSKESTCVIPIHREGI